MNNEKPRISVIIPVYNNGGTIKRCVDSVLRQSAEGLEIIAVNDGSTDDTLRVLEGFGDKITLISKENGGVSSARNVGLKAAGGKYIGFVDGDDEIEPDMYKRMLGRAEEEGAEVVQCNILNIFPDGEAAVELPRHGETVRIAERAGYAEKYLPKYLHSYEITNKLLRRDFIIKNGLSFDERRELFAEDLLFNLKLIENLSVISFVDEPFYKYYIHDGSLMNRNPVSRLSGTITLFESYFKDCPTELCGALAPLAAKILLQYAASTGENARKLAQWLSTPLFTRCMRESARRSERAMHKLLMLVLLSPHTAMCTSHRLPTTAISPFRLRGR